MCGGGDGFVGAGSRGVQCGGGGALVGEDGGEGVIWKYMFVVIFSI